MSDIVSRLRIENRKLKEEHLECARLATILTDSLRARVEVLERIRAAADDLFAYDSGWSHWEQKYRALRAALKEATP